MANIKREKPRGIQRVEESFLAAAWQPSRWEEALQVASDEIGAPGAALLPVYGSVPRLAVAPRLAEAFADFVASGWYFHDERRRGVPTLLRDGALIEHDFITEEEIDRLPFYQEFCRRHGLRWFGGIKLQTPNDVWCVAFQLRMVDGPFSFKDKARLARWGRRLNVAANLAVDLSRAKASMIGDLLEAFGKPCFLLDRTGALIRANAHFEVLLGPHCRIANRRLMFSNRAGNEAFAEAVRRLLDPQGNCATVGPVPIRREGRRPLILSLVKLEFIDSNPFAEARVLVLINDLDERPLVKHQQLQQAFGLTRAEAALTSILSEGIELSEAADRLSITVQTARSQLKSVFRKTDTNRQAALMALLARINLVG
jgi:DNA-binding CsgD family transcriptional regulator